MTQPKVGLAESCVGRSPAEKGALRGIKFGVRGIRRHHDAKKLKSVGSWFGQERRAFSGVIMRCAQGRVTRLATMAPVYKQYYYLPMIPKVQDGWLVVPGSPIPGGTGRIWKSLNSYPDNFREFECVYRRIEAHWYIQMCQERFEY